MPISPIRSLSVGLDALRANPLRTLLSTLGIVMGVGAMVSVLSMGDGVERFAREQIERTTDFLAVTVTPTVSNTVDGLSVRRPDIIQFTSADGRQMAEEFPDADKVDMITGGAALVVTEPGGSPRGFAVEGTLSRRPRNAGYVLAAGRWFEDSDTAVVVLSSRAAGVVAGDSTGPAAALGSTLLLQGNPHRVIGVLEPEELERGLRAFVPVDDAARALPGARIPSLVLAAARIEDVDSLRTRLESWGAARGGPEWKQRLTVASNRGRAQQAATAMRVFRILMGAITGVSLLVGGVGIMNVLLAAVAERTREIGIRKATGARDRDILVQFLAESVAITGAGAMLGVLVGLGIAFASAAVMRAQTEAPVYPAITASTILFAAGAAVIVGLVFGLYPALRASRLSPIDAIRHE
jgi:putative ABC transport system permease protein